jgi:hypothetical protein
MQDDRLLEFESKSVLAGAWHADCCAHGMKLRPRWWIPATVGLLTVLMQQWMDIGAAVNDALGWIGWSQVAKLAGAASAFPVFP